LVTHGPVYAAYDNLTNTSEDHIVLVTGVDISKNLFILTIHGVLKGFKHLKNLTMDLYGNHLLMTFFIYMPSILSVIFRRSKMKNRRIYKIIALIILGILVLVYILLSDGYAYTRVKKISTDLYVNGKCVENASIMYWYNSAGAGNARYSIKLVPTLEALGCEIDGDVTKPNSEAVLRIRGREFTIKRDGCSSYLFENEMMVYLDVALPENRNTGRGPLYLEDYKCIDVLSFLGFDQVSCETDEEEKTVKLYAELAR
jgi:hypothetical protein